MQISGLRVLVDTMAPPKMRCLALHDASGKKIEEGKSYKVATNEFVVKGGDGYTVFAKGLNVIDTKTLIRDVVAQYLKEKRSLDPSEDHRYQSANSTGSVKRSTECAP